MLLTLPLPAFVFADCPRLKDGETAILKSYDEMRNGSDFKTLENCLLNLISSKNYQENDTYFYYYIRSLIWQKKYDEAEKNLLHKKSKDRESLELWADLYWFQSKHVALLKHLREMKRIQNLNWLSPELEKRMVVSILNSDSEEIAREYYLKLKEVYPAEKVILSLKNIFVKEPKNKYRLAYDKYNESQSRSYREIRASATHSDESKRYSLLANYLTRDFGSTKLSDLIVGIGGMYKIDPWDFGIDFDYTIGQEFASDYAITPKIYRKLPSGFVLGLEYGFRHYNSGFSSNGAWLLEWYYKNLSLQQRFGFNFKSYLIKPIYSFPRWCDLALWLGFGKSESSRPYLVGNDEKSYHSYGSSLFLHRGTLSGPTITYEHRTESNYRHDMVGLSYQDSF